MGKKRPPAGAIEEEETFVRGGGSGLAPVVERKLKEEAYAEAEADLLSGKKGGKRRKGGQAVAGGEGGDEEDAFFSGLALQGKLPKFVELLKFKNLSRGCKLWGAVIEVSPRELVVSLPHGLRGHVAYAEASDWLAGQSKAAAAAGAEAAGEDGAAAIAAAAAGKKRKAGTAAATEVVLPPLTDLFTIGQLVRGTVVALRSGSSGDSESAGKAGAKKAAAAEGGAGGAKKKRVDLSLRVSKMNAGLGPESLREGLALPACVSSVEDHGYLLALGVKGVSGFLPKKAAAAAGRALAPGMLLDVAVPPGGAPKPAGGGGSVLGVVCAPEAVAMAVAREWEGLNIGSLLPGQLVAARVRNVLSDGLLCSFLTYFSGTVDPFHLGADLAADWRKQFSPNQRLRARILYVDPASKRVALTLHRHLISASLPVNFPMLGQVDVRPGMPVSGTVSRVEEYGLLVALTSSIRALVPVLHASDVGTAKALRKFKAGQTVAGKVLTVDPATKKVTMTLKPSLVGSKLPPIARTQDAVPGGRSHGVVTGARDFGVFVSFFGGVTGLAHVSECGLAADQKPPEAFQAGQVVKCRVLGADPSRKGLKLSLVTKPKKAAAAAAETEAAPLAAAAAPGAAGEPAPGGSEAGGSSEAAAAAALASYQAGELVEGTVAAVHTKEVDGEAVPAYFELSVSSAGGGSDKAAAAGRLEVAHLADHPAAAAALVAALTVGSRLGPLLVLQRLENVKQLRLTRKASLLTAAAAGLLPSAVEAVAEGALLAGYVASVTSGAVFVRFLDGLTGRAGLAQLSDTFVSDPHLFFREGQSVRATVVDAQRQRFSVALKQSLCGSRDAAYLQSLFSDLEAAEALSNDAADVDWAAFAIGGIAPGEVHEAKGYGLICDLEAHADVVGLVAPHQMPAGASREPGTSVRAVVLDANKREGVVDLSLQPRLVAAAQAAAAAADAETAPKKKKQKKAAVGGKAAAAAELKEGQRLECKVELVKEEAGYCVVTLPAADGSPTGSPLLGFLPTTDFNLQYQQHQQPPRPGDSLTASVAALPSPATGGRLLLAAPVGGKPVKPAAAAGGTGAAKRPQSDKQQAQRMQQHATGSCVEATVGAVHALHADLDLDKLAVAVLGRVTTAEGRRHSVLECSSRPEAVSAARAGQALPRHPCPALAALRPGQQLQGYVQDVQQGHVWCAFSPSVRGRAFATQAASSIEECERLGKRFKPGQPVQATVVHVDKKRKALDVSLLPAAPEAASEAAAAGAPAPGTVALGRVSAVGGGGVRVRLSARSVGRVALTDIHDGAVEECLAGLQAGQYCQAVVLGPDTSASPDSGQEASGRKRGGRSSGAAAGQLLLSLRPSAGGRCAAHGAAQRRQGGAGAEVAAGQLQPAQLKPGQKVRACIFHR
ncbi:hypothetical protein CHLNCDRAFT_145628 [Chlorella variabilis]|uniref:S1 motif domain-containing protein n=1 Tax=Chlorella variabilis TaxID=554065 RepID=E1ZDW0_CHLVA|nr:hypothetical protein CHLNCDRAFT_145628 [Chlorella variabilis]EFN56095.1 hypothetical protein CHLNCDRAFT_145628 [Chlorella variabilis]|eukprot:XP_005848197.1 hypothetical protein CHLNCDRAFT_145628 [Chlorella variabilis]